MTKSSDVHSIELRLRWLPKENTPPEVATAYATLQGALEHLQDAWEEHEQAEQGVPDAKRNDIRAATDALAQGDKPPKAKAEAAERRLEQSIPRLEAARDLARKAHRDLERAAMSAWPTWRRALIDETIPELQARADETFQAFEAALSDLDAAYTKVRLFDAEAATTSQHRPSFSEVVDTYGMTAANAVKGSSKPSRRADGTHLPRPHNSRTPAHAVKVLSEYLTTGRDGHYLTRWAPLGDPARAAIQALTNDKE